MQVAVLLVPPSAARTQLQQGSSCHLHQLCLPSLCSPSLAPSIPVQPPAGKVERKEHILDERDALFSDLRHKHFAAASLAISRLMDEFKVKRAAGPAAGWLVWGQQQATPCVCKHREVASPGTTDECAAPARPSPLLLLRPQAKNGRGIKGSSGELDLRNMSKLLQSLPQYRCVCVCACVGGRAAGCSSGVVELGTATLRLAATGGRAECSMWHTRHKRSKCMAANGIWWQLNRQPSPACLAVHAALPWPACSSPPPPLRPPLLACLQGPAVQAGGAR